MIAFLGIQNLSAQDDKATVYIVRTSGAGAVINFKYFINDQYIGKTNHGKYLKLELDPGEHIIWAASENKSFVKANLEAGQTYVINALALAGAFKASVRLIPITEADERALIRCKKYVSKKKLRTFTEEEITKGQIQFANIISKGMERYEKVLAKGNVAILNQSVDWDNIDITKKSKKNKQKDSRK
ncbi:MAG: DUF2846 domain-containing protein [Bacteroidota bacterium]